MDKVSELINVLYGKNNKFSKNENSANVLSNYQFGLVGLIEIELDKGLEKGYKDYIRGHVKSLDEAFSDIYEDYEI